MATVLQPRIIRNRDNQTEATPPKPSGEGLLEKLGRALRGVKEDGSTLARDEKLRVELGRIERRLAELEKVIQPLVDRKAAERALADEAADRLAVARREGAGDFFRPLTDREIAACVLGPFWQRRREPALDRLIKPHTEERQFLLGELKRIQAERRQLAIEAATAGL